MGGGVGHVTTVGRVRAQSSLINTNQCRQLVSHVLEKTRIKSIVEKKKDTHQSTAGPY